MGAMKLAPLSALTNWRKHTETLAEGDDAEIERDGQLDKNELLLLQRKLHHLHQLLNTHPEGLSDEICEQISDGFDNVHQQFYLEGVPRPELPKANLAYYLFLRGLKEERVFGSPVKAKYLFLTAHHLAKRCGDVSNNVRYIITLLGLPSQLPSYHSLHEDDADDLSLSKLRDNLQCTLYFARNPLTKKSVYYVGSLHPNGGGFVAYTANVDLEAVVEEGAQVLDYATVSHDAVIGGTCRGRGHAVIEPNANLYGNLRVGEFVEGSVTSLHVPVGWYDKPEEIDALNQAHMAELRASPFVDRQQRSSTSTIPEEGQTSARESLDTLTYFTQIAEEFAEKYRAWFQRGLYTPTGIKMAIGSTSGTTLGGWLMFQDERSLAFGALGIVSLLCGIAGITHYGRHRESYERLQEQDEQGNP